MNPQRERPEVTGTEFNRRLKSAVADGPSGALVFLGNFEVEEQWARGETGLPRLSSAGNTAVVNRMDEFALLLGDVDDHVVLKTEPDPGYLAYLRELGIGLPTVHVVRGQHPGNTVTQDALADPRLSAVLGELGAQGALLSPHGVSEWEEDLAGKAGIALAAPSAELCKAVNSKVYSRRVADELGLRQPRGWACETLGELRTAVAAAAELLDAGTTMLLKEAYGVSGKGIAEIESTRRLERTERMVANSARKSGAEGIAFVLEEKVAKVADLNYQFTIARDGAVRLDFVKEAITEGGVHKGHRFPPRLTAAQHEVIDAAAGLLGRRLADDGFFGVVGVDAMLDPDGGVYPVIEINARNNMSTYQVRLQEQLLGEGRLALARHYPLVLERALPFDTLRQVLGDLLLDRPGGSGLVVNNYATVNAGSSAGGPFNGRLYGLVMGDSPEELAALDEAVGARLGPAGALGASGVRSSARP
ncbi:ATP-grasp domain-containing protein [Streptomyces cinereoruber]|uniref:preATP grasp domain-containing protein n=1 Tax=Streptomyces cinereoruber TaxID=67260 RepID=UPI00345DF57F